jgi:hypothetical protein
VVFVGAVTYLIRKRGQGREDVSKPAPAEDPDVALDA